MRTVKEFTFTANDKTSSIDHICRSLRDSGARIVGFQSVVNEQGKTARFAIDDPVNVRTCLKAGNIDFDDADVVLVDSQQHDPLEFARISSQLRDTNVQVSHSYTGIDLATGTPVFIIGVSDFATALGVIDPNCARATSMIDPSGGVAHAMIDPTGGVAHGMIDPAGGGARSAASSEDGARFGSNEPKSAVAYYGK